MKQKIQNQGLTLIEIMVTVAIFSLIFGVISGLFAAGLKAQKRSLASQELLSQMSYVMEYMSRHLRMAGEEESGSCLSQIGSSYETTTNGIKFVTHEECCWEFFLQGERLKRKEMVSSCPSGDEEKQEFLTSANFEVEEFNIRLVEESNKQPRITIFLRIRGKGEKIETQPLIEIQNTISQRNLNVQ